MELDCKLELQQEQDPSVRVNNADIYMSDWVSGVRSCALVKAWVVSMVMYVRESIQ